MCTHVVGKETLCATCIKNPHMMATMHASAINISHGKLFFITGANVKCVNFFFCQIVGARYLFHGQ